MLRKSQRSFVLCFYKTDNSIRHLLTTNGHVHSQSIHSQCDDKHLTTKTPGEPGQLQSVKAEVHFFIHPHARKPLLTVGI